MAGTAVIRARIEMCHPDELEESPPISGGLQGCLTRLAPGWDSWNTRDRHFIVSSRLANRGELRGIPIWQLKLREQAVADCGLAATLKGLHTNLSADSVSLAAPVARCR